MELLSILPRLRFFNTNGESHNFNILSLVDFIIINSNESSAKGYINTFASGNFELIITEPGQNFEPDNSNIESIYFVNKMTDKIYPIDLNSVSISYKEIPYQYGSSSLTVTHGIDTVKFIEQDSELTEFIKSTFPYPSIRLSGSIIMDPISTDLVETSIIRVLEEYEPSKFRTPFIDYNPNIDDDSDPDYLKFPALSIGSDSNVLKLIEVNTESDSLTWKNSTKRFAPYYKPYKSTYHPNISNYIQHTELKNLENPEPFTYILGFSTPIEGVYTEKINIYLLSEKVITQDPGKLTSDDIKSSFEYLDVGSINVQCESIGLDERFRTIFDNFGIPDPINYSNVFKETELDQDSKNAEFINEKSKELFLSYDEIFPFVGTYKALINSVNYLGYDDIYFREWYKLTDPSAKSDYVNYVSVDMSQSLEQKIKSVNLDLDSFLGMKKLNRLSMVYSLNRETNLTDFADVPITTDVYSYNNSEILIKLYALREWLDTHIIGVNARISDISGEGIYFQYYKTQEYSTGTYKIQNEISQTLTPTAVDGKFSTELYSDTLSADIDLTLKEFTHTTFADLSEYRIKDFVRYIIDATPIPSREPHKTIIDNLKSEDYYNQYGFIDIFEIGQVTPVLGSDNNILYNFRGVHSDISKWDPNNIFQIPISSPCTAPMLYDDLHFDLILDADYGNIIESIKPIESYKYIDQNASPEEVFNASLLFEYKNSGSVMEWNKNRTSGQMSKRISRVIPNPIQVFENEISFYHPSSTVSEFERLPVLKIQRGALRNLHSSWANSIEYTIDSSYDSSIGSYVYEITNKTSQKSKDRRNIQHFISKLSYDYITLVPRLDDSSSFRYEYIDSIENPMFIVKGYDVITNNVRSETHIKNDPSFLGDTEFIVEITEGGIYSVLKEPRSDGSYLTESIHFTDFAFDGDINFEKTITPSYVYNKNSVPVFEYQREKIISDLKNLLAIYQGPRSILGGSLYPGKIEQYKTHAQSKFDALIESAGGQSNFKDDSAGAYETIMETYADRLRSRFLYDIMKVLDGNLSINDLVSFTVNHTGDYQVSVKATDSFGNIFSNTIKNPITVYSQQKDIWLGTPYFRSLNSEPFYKGNMKGLPAEEIYDYKIKLPENINDFDLEFALYRNSVYYNEFINADNRTPKFIREGRVYGLSAHDYKNNILTYPVESSFIDTPKKTDFCLFSNISERVMSFEVLDYVDPVNPNIVRLKFNMSINTPGNQELFSRGLNLNLYAYDIDKFKLVAELNNMKVISYDRIKDAPRFGDNFIVCDVEINSGPNYDTIIEGREFSNIRFYLGNAHKYQILNYENDIQNKQCTIELYSSIDSDLKFKKNQTIKISSSRPVNYKKFYGNDYMITKTEYQSETSYKVLDSYYSSDLERPNVQYIVIKGFIDEYRHNKNEDNSEFSNLYLSEHSKQKLSISYPNQRYTSYLGKLLSDATEDINQAYLPLDNSNLLFNYIDNTYSLIAVDYNPEDAFTDWLTNPEVLYPSLRFYNIPMTVEKGTALVMTSKNKPDSRINKDGIPITPRYKNIWNISLSRDTIDSKKLLYRVINSSNFMRMSRDSEYHVDLITIDEYGNAVKTRAEGLIKTVPVGSI